MLLIYCSVASQFRAICLGISEILFLYPLLKTTAKFFVPVIVQREIYILQLFLSAHIPVINSFL